MTDYKQVPFNLSDGQIMKINKGIKDESEVTIQIGMKNIVSGSGSGNIVLNLTDTQVKNYLN